MTVFDPTRTACIDETSTTTVWRGNLPIDAGGHLAYPEISAALGLAKDCSFVDVSLIDNIAGGERDRWLLELEAYGVDADVEFPSGPNVPPQFQQPNWNPGKLLGTTATYPAGSAPGSLVWWQIEGGDTPDVLGPALRSYNFVGLIEYMGVLRQLPSSAVYVHCMNGTDRTGAVVAAYGIRWQGLSLDEAFAKADSLTAAGTMNADYQRLVQAYWAAWQSRT